jgi:hypothetical protein
MTEIGKSYISDSIQDLELLFFNNEQYRLKKIKSPFYDGGLTPIVLYYTRKYKLPIKFPIFIENIKGNTLFEITSNFYPYNMNRIDLESTEYDLFSSQYIKNYYFSNTFYDIKVVYNKFKGLYESKQLNQTGEFYWMYEITNVLLSFLAVKEKKSIGVNDNDMKKNYYFRVRTKTDAQGRIVSANYGKIYGDFFLDPANFDWGYYATLMLVDTYFNPTNNDRNVEFDLKKNLLQNSDVKYP